VLHAVLSVCRRGEAGALTGGSVLRPAAYNMVGVNDSAGAPAMQVDVALEAQSAEHQCSVRVGPIAEAMLGSRFNATVLQLS
jgi:hypothetical protein